jgi:abortive infection bacteriophage resistance protein
MLKLEKGVTFEHMTESMAIEYLRSKNNYMRTASYRKNYDKHTSGTNKGKYIHLDFSYLAELSTIDMHLRIILLQMCIDFEHALKVAVLAAIESNPFENGYSIVDRFLSKNSDIKVSIEKKADSIFTGNLIDKYFNLCYVVENNGNVNTRILNFDCPAWVLVETIGYGELIRFIGFYNSEYPNYRVQAPERNILNPVRSLRNACAHNNCLLNNLRPHGTQPPPIISKYIVGFKSIGKEERKNKLSCRPLFEIVCLLYAYISVVPESMVSHRIIEFNAFIDERMFKHINYFENNDLIQTSFHFPKKVLDNLNEVGYTNSVIKKS